MQDGDFLHWNIRQEMIIDVIKDAEPDVACFQEAPPLTACGLFMRVKNIHVDIDLGLTDQLKFDLVFLSSHVCFI